MSQELPRINARREYLGVVARNYRSGPRLHHIAEFTLAEKPVRLRRARFGTALCGVKVSDYPESGEQGKPENASCQKCQSKFKRIQEA